MLTTKDIENIKKTILKNKSSILKLEDIYKILSKTLKVHTDDLKTIEYDLFYKSVRELENANVIKPYGKNTNSMMFKSVYLKYRIIDHVKVEHELSQEDKQFLHSLNSKIDTSFYFKNTKELESDKDTLLKLSEFLNSVEWNTPYLSLNERSYELFGYEKRLSGAGVTSSLINRTKITLNDICCFETYTPLQCHTMYNFYKREKKTILIVENLDTYWSFHRAMNESSLGDKIDMLVYGCGNKSAGNFKFHRHYSITPNDNIYYFGDVDPEGLAIFNRVKKSNPELNIKLSNDLYKLAIEIGFKRGLRDIPNENQTVVPENELDAVLSSLDNETRENFKYILTNDKYIPQEAVNYRILMEKIR